MNKSWNLFLFKATEKVQTSLYHLIHYMQNRVQKHKIGKCCHGVYSQVNQVGTADKMPLLVAASNGSVDLVELLCVNGADVNAQVCRRTSGKMVLPQENISAFVCCVYLSSVCSIHSVTGEHKINKFYVNQDFNNTVYCFNSNVHI